MTLVGGLAVVLGTLMIAGGFAWHRWVTRRKARHRELVERRKIVEGIVAENRGDGDGYSAVITYSVDGAEYRIAGEDDSYIPWPIGKAVAVAYDPARPSDAVEVEYDDSWDRRLALALCVGGVVVGGLAVLGFVD